MQDYRPGSVITAVTRLKHLGSMALRPPHIVNVKREVDGAIRGYVVARNSQLTVVREFDGFAPAGFVALPSSTVADLTINEAWTRMIASEGHAELATIAPSFATNDMRSALKSIHRLNVNVKIECE
ncbi:hypothetical protein [Thalassoglobus neptunius]|nr:hypothetical protein [Thalassoglobus neptunius]